VNRRPRGAPPGASLVRAMLVLCLVAIAGLEGWGLWVGVDELTRLQAELRTQEAALSRARSVAADAAGVRAAAAAAEAELAALRAQLPETLGATELQQWLQKAAAGAGAQLTEYRLEAPRKEGRITAIPAQVVVAPGHPDRVLAFLRALRDLPFPVRTDLTAFEFREAEAVAISLRIYTRGGLTYP